MEAGCPTSPRWLPRNRHSNCQKSPFSPDSRTPVSAKVRQPAGPAGNTANTHRRTTKNSPAAGHSRKAKQMTRYTEPTAQQLEEARALIFLAATKRELRHSEHIWDLTLEIEVEHTVHNQRQYLIHAARGTQSIAGEEGYYVHPASGTPYTAAWHLRSDAMNSARKPAAAKDRAAEQPHSLTQVAASSSRQVLVSPNPTVKDIKLRFRRRLVQSVQSIAGSRIHQLQVSTACSRSFPEAAPGQEGPCARTPMGRRPSVCSGARRRPGPAGPWAGGPW